MAETKTKLAGTLENIMEWTLMSEAKDFPVELKNQLASGERVIKAYRTFRDTAVFTSHRIIIKDVQGLRSKEFSTYSIPYRSINTWALHTTGLADFNAELELWTREGHFMLKLSRKIDIEFIGKIIATGALAYA